MAKYRYKGRSMGGHAIDGETEADNTDQVAAQLISSGITPLVIDEVKGQQDVFAPLRDQLFVKKATLDDLILFCRQAHALAKSGVPMIRAFTGLTEGTPNPQLSQALKDIVNALQSGRSLATAMAEHSKVFPPLFISMIQVGEESGRLDEAFLQLAFYLELEKETRNRIKAALRYPSFVLVAICAAMAIINVFVIPAFSKVFDTFNAELPLPTKILLGVSDFTVHNWPYMAGIVVLIVIGVGQYLKTERGAFLWDRKKMYLPIVGSIILRATLGRFARAFAMASRSGVPLLQAMGAVGQAVDNRYVAFLIHSMREGIERGDSLTRTAAATKLFTPLVLQMMAVGEETGSMDSLMQEVAEFYEREVDYELKALSSNIEPILLAVVGVMVLILALGIFLPMWELGAAAIHQ
ncbi:type II secretion system F family protein [Endothiovibrio diazotrophicus]